MFMARLPMVMAVSQKITWPQRKFRCDLVMSLVGLSGIFERL